MDLKYICIKKKELIIKEISSQELEQNCKTRTELKVNNVKECVIDGTNKDRLSIDVAKLYYKSDYSQQQIANKLNLSRPTVSRLLQYAKEKGFVQINIADPIEDNSSLEEALCEKYNLDVVKIAYAPLNTTNEIKKSISMKAADYLYEIAKDGDIIGVCWGTTIYNMALNLKKKR